MQPLPYADSGAKVINLPTRVRYLARSEGGVSHFRMGRDNLLISWMHTRMVVGAIVRLIPGVLGAADGAADVSFADGLLEHPQYTRPREFRGLAVPDVLLSGNHAQIASWRRSQREIRTRERRPDLWQRFKERQDVKPPDAGE